MMCSKPSTRLTLTVIGIALLVAPLTVLTGCQSNKIRPPVVVGEAQSKLSDNVKRTVRLNASQVNTMEIETEPVVYGTVPIRVMLTGTVQAIPNETVRIGTPVSGRVESVSVNLEDNVYAGQTLVTLFSNEIGQTQTELLNTLLDLQASQLQHETDLQLAQSTFEREKKLYDAKVSAKADLDASQANLTKVTKQLHSIHDKRKALIDMYDNRLRLMGATPGSAHYVTQTKQLQPRVFLTAPKAGIVIARNANPGEWVDGNSEMITVANLSRVWIVAQAFEKDLASLDEGETVAIQLDSRPGQTLIGHISRIGSELHPETRTLDVKIEVPNPNLWLKPNLFARIGVTVGARKGLLIPKTAVQTFGDRKIVYIQIAPDLYRQKTIIITGDDNEDRIAVEGLNVHDKVVKTGAIAIHGEWLKQQY